MGGDVTGLYCAGAACVEGGTDQETCCDAREVCESTACTSATHVLREDLTGLYCAGAACVEGGTDQETCCDARPVHCTDGVQNEDEAGVDCGGSSCSPCWSTAGVTQHKK